MAKLTLVFGEKNPSGLMNSESAREGQIILEFDEKEVDDEFMEISVFLSTNDHTRLSICQIGYVNSFCFIEFLQLVSKDLQDGDAAFMMENGAFGLSFKKKEESIKFEISAFSLHDLSIVDEKGYGIQLKSQKFVVLKFLFDNC
jgi:hypothetical protein